jgi:hypothetical protein
VSQRKPTIGSSSESIDSINRDQYFGGYFSPENVSYRINLGAYKGGLSEKPPEKKWPQRSYADITDTALGKALLSHYRDSDWLLKQDNDLGGYFSKDRINERLKNAINGR